MAQSKSPSADRKRVVSSFQNAAPTNNMARSPVKIAVQDLVDDSTPTGTQDRVYSHELQGGHRKLAHSRSITGSLTQAGQNPSVRKKRRTAAERAEQKSVKSSLATLDDGMATQQTADARAHSPGHKQH